MGSTFFIESMEGTLKKLVPLILAGVVLAGCQTTTGGSATQASAPAWMSIVGKTLVNGDTKVVLNNDGSIVGDGIAGTWNEQDGKYCRTLTEPERFAGTECQVVSLDGNQVTFDNQKGRTSTWTIQ